MRFKYNNETINLVPYTGQELKSNELLIRIREYTTNFPSAGFLSKLNKNGTVPVKLKNWYGATSDIYVLPEVYRSGWKLNGFRNGQSQVWAEMLHPFGFTVEIYMKQFFEYLTGEINNDPLTLMGSELIGEFKWEDKKLIRKDD